MGCGSSNSSSAQDTTKPTSAKREEKKVEDSPKEQNKGKNNTETKKSSDQASQFEKESLEAHNKCRVKHGAPPMTLNRELCEIAQKWANHLAAKKDFNHSTEEDRNFSKGSTGENLAMSMSTGAVNANGGDAVDDWYSEIKDYDFNNQGFSMNTGHFTQVVWQESVELGIAHATYKDGGSTNVIVVGNYYPAGNMMSAFEENVKPPSSSASDGNTL